MKREEVIQVIMELADDLDCTFEEAAFDMIDQFYEAAGFYGNQIEKEFGHLSKEDLIDVVWELYTI